MGRVGLGPVFAYEWLTGSRRWQVYALRSAFVACLLVGLGIVWARSGSAAMVVTIGGASQVGRAFTATIVGVQIALLLLAAPAATAGAICLDKARGTLAHLMVTDLSDTEIVLGKLAARLVPVLGLVACSAPVMLIMTLLGGTDPEGLLGAVLLSVGLAVLGCTLALTLSVWGTKTHEVLLATYLLWALWLLASPVWGWLVWTLGAPTGPDEWLKWINPFYLGLRSYWSPGHAVLWPYVVFCSGCLVASAGLVGLAVARVRAVAAREGRRRTAKRRRALPAFSLSRRLGAWLSPSLDGNPILWREWHRERPSRWSRNLWMIYYGGAIVFNVLIVVPILLGDGNRNMSAGSAAFLNGFQVSVGLLLLSVSAATALAEERVRGSLDLMMATPLSTPAIVWGKWCGAFRQVAPLTLLPCVVMLAGAVTGGWWLGVAAMVASVLSYGAVVTSIGLAAATWTPRLGRAVATTVTAYVLIAVGSFPLFWSGPTNERAAMFSSFFGPGNLTFHMLQPQNTNVPLTDWQVLITSFLWSAAFATLAAVLLGLTLATFDRCLGRVSVLGRPPRLMRRPIGDAKPSVKAEDAFLTEPA